MDIKSKKLNIAIAILKNDQFGSAWKMILHLGAPILLNIKLIRI